MMKRVKVITFRNHAMIRENISIVKKQNNTGVTVGLEINYSFRLI